LLSSTIKEKKVKEKRLTRISPAMKPSQKIDNLNQTIPQFPQLPRELRDLVWKFALPDSKCITISSDFNTTTWYPRAEESPRMFACSEAREAFLRTHKLLEGTDDGKKDVWVNFDRDIICFGPYFCWINFGAVITSIPESIRNSLRYVFMSTDNLSHSLGSSPFDGVPEDAAKPISLYDALSQTPNVKEVLIGPDTYNHYAQGCIQHLQRIVEMWDKVREFTEEDFATKGVRRTKDASRAEDISWALKYIGGALEEITRDKINTQHPKMVLVEWNALEE
jgi:hypothetical protein